MSRLAVFAVICTLISLQVVCGKSLKNTGPDFEITNGDCSHTVVSDLVDQYHSHKYPIPLVTRDEIHHYSGDQRIYCVQVRSKEDSSSGSTAEITGGGYNYTFANIRLKSKKGNGYEYEISIFAK